MSIRDRYAELGIDVTMLDDIQLEGVTLDVLAEFGEIQPTVEQLEAIVARHAAKPPRSESAYTPAIELHALLDFEGENHPSWRKASAIRNTFGVTQTRYQQLLNRAIEDPEGIRYAPALTARLTRIRDARRLLRTGRRGEVSA